ncbi:MAG: aspartate--tRNA(Asn) ligase [Cenarchaeum sp. SB0678_bin_8]|nr:aspartate--tRNA(Asn) ligase [Cenarchaeum sp. SB0666_bin_15]MYD59139.1 aspartate--tRNA(Asn) ligase [Cenarchaeum sp. SB0678_bin_8]MYJ27329.1 aspartate--tRNA(Asn) ligase [Cenarchaeum sp. SB0672_bin_9]
MEFTKSHDVADLEESMIGNHVTLGGWIEDLRKMGKIVFVTLRDASGRCQIVAKGQAGSDISSMSRQSVIRVHGTLQATKSHDFDFEVNADSVQLLTEAVHPLPVDPMGRLQSNIDTRLNHRALDMRNPRTSAIFRIRHTALQSIRNYLAKRYIEITTPKIIGSASEGGANLFSLEYFGRTAYLAQSPQLYKEQMTLGLERVFEVSNFYRAENSNTGRHLTEFTSVDIEAAFMDYTDVMHTLETLIYKIMQDVQHTCISQLSSIPHQLTAPATPFEVITYEDALREVNEHGHKLKFGDDLQDAHLRIVGENHPGFYFLTDWPMSLKPFYIMGKDGNPEISKSFDLQYGHLELSSGGTRLHNADMIKERLIQQGLNPEQFTEHLGVFKCGMPPHSGWGMGLDRLMTILTGTSNVREVVLYPRDPVRLLP